MKKRLNIAFASLLFLFNMVSCASSTGIHSSPASASTFHAESTVGSNTVSNDSTTQGTILNTTTTSKQGSLVTKVPSTVGSSKTTKRSTTKPPATTSASKTSQPPYKTINILFMGNSLTYTYDMPYMFEQIAESKGKKIYVDYTLLVHPGDWIGYLDENPDLYSTVLHDYHWDYVVIQNMTTPCKYDFDIHAIGAKELVYLTPCQNGCLNQYRMQGFEYDIKYIAEKGCAVVPSIYINEIVAEKYNYQILQEDKLHPSQIGAYITACTMYSAIFNESPFGGNDSGLDGTGLEGKSKEMQALTWDSLQSFYQKYSQYPCLKLSNNANF